MQDDETLHQGALICTRKKGSLKRGTFCLYMGFQPSAQLARITLCHRNCRFKLGYHFFPVTIERSGKGQKI